MVDFYKLQYSAFCILTTVIFTVIFSLLIILVNHLGREFKSTSSHTNIVKQVLTGNWKTDHVP